MPCLCIIHHEGFGLFHHWSFWGQCFVFDIIQICCFTPVARLTYIWCSLRSSCSSCSPRLTSTLLPCWINAGRQGHWSITIFGITSHGMSIPFVAPSWNAASFMRRHSMLKRTQGHFTTTALHRIQQDPQAEIGMTGWVAEGSQLLTSAFTQFSEAPAAETSRSFHNRSSSERTSAWTRLDTKPMAMISSSRPWQSRAEIPIPSRLAGCTPTHLGGKVSLCTWPSERRSSRIAVQSSLDCGPAQISAPNDRSAQSR